MIMRGVTLAATVLVALLLAGCGDVGPVGADGEPKIAAAGRPAAAAPTSTIGRAITAHSTPPADLPAAPPVTTWVVKGRDLQMTLDLNMQAELIDGLKMSPQTATVEVARSLAYHVCTGARAGQREGDLIQQAYPETPVTAVLGLILAANAYCLDTAP